MAQHGAVGQRGHGALQVQHLLDRHLDCLGTQRRQQFGKLTDAFRVRAAAPAGIDPAADLQHIAAVECAGRLDVRDPVAEVANGALGRSGLGLALIGAGSGDDGEVTEDNNGVFDEDRVRAVGCGLDLRRRPSVRVQRIHVLLPLTLGELHVDALTVEVGEQALGETWAGAADEGVLVGHPAILWPSGTCFCRTTSRCFCVDTPSACRRGDAHAPRSCHTRRGCAARLHARVGGVRHHRSMEELVVGFDRTTLRPTVDIARAEARLSELGESRSLTALLERARLLAATGDVDRATSLAASAVVQARTSGRREDALHARLVRASVAQIRGDAVEAEREAGEIVDEARSADFVGLWARALQLRGITRFDQQRWADAAADFTRALALRRDAAAPQTLVDESEISLLVAQDHLAHAEHAAPKRAVHPLFG